MTTTMNTEDLPLVGGYSQDGIELEPVDQQQMGVTALVTGVGFIPMVVLLVIGVIWAARILF